MWSERTRTIAKADQKQVFIIINNKVLLEMLRHDPEILSISNQICNSVIIGNEMPFNEIYSLGENHTLINFYIHKNEPSFENGTLLKGRTQWRGCRVILLEHNAIEDKDISNSFFKTKTKLIEALKNID